MNIEKRMRRLERTNRVLCASVVVIFGAGLLAFVHVDHPDDEGVIVARAFHVVDEEGRVWAVLGEDAVIQPERMTGGGYLSIRNWNGHEAVRVCVRSRFEKTYWGSVEILTGWLSQDYKQIGPVRIVDGSRISQKERNDPEFMKEALRLSIRIRDRHRKGEGK